MPTITFNAFASLQKKLKNKNIGFANAEIDIESNLSAQSFLSQMGLNKKDVEVILINGKVISMETIIKDGDRVAFVPRFTNSPNRDLPGLKIIKKAL